MYTSRAILAVSVFLVVGEAFRKKSSKTDAELEGGSFVEAEANTKAGERAQTLKDMKALAHKVVAGEEKIYDETLKALKRVEWVIHLAASEVKPQFKGHQDELDDAKEMFDDCKAAYIKKTEEIREKEGKRTGEFGDIHNKSRSIEHQALDNKGSTCGKFQDYNAELSPPDCARNFPGLCEWPARISCIEDLADWSNTHKAKYDTMKVPCQEAWQEHKTASKNAADSQRNFEFELCRWGVELKDACEEFAEICWNTATTNREVVHSKIFISEKALKAEFFAIEKIKCYINVLKAPEEEMPAVLKGCEDELFNKKLEERAEKELSNTYHPIPAKPDCLTVPAPCDAEWRQKTYVSQSWFEFTAGKQFCNIFPDGAEKVKTTECLKECHIEPIIVKCTASVYSEKHFTGNVATFSVGEYMHDEFVSRGPLQNDKASSIKVQGPPGCKATLYEKDYFGGWEAVFPVGDYDYDKFLAQGAENDQASSIKVTL